MANLIELINILGYPMLHDEAASILRKNGFEPTYKEKILRSEGSVFLGTRASGIELSFGKRSDYEDDFAQAKAPGEAIFAAIFIEPAYIKDYASFVLPDNMHIQNCKNRSEALHLFGQADRFRERDGVFKWETWILEPELSIRAEYNDDQTIRMWTIGPLMKL
jgi:hypothetical protein